MKKDSMKKILMVLSLLSVNAYAVDDSVEILERYKAKLADEPYVAAKTINRDIKVGQKTELVNYLFDNLNDEAKQLISEDAHYINRSKSAKYEKEDSLLVSQLQEYFSLNPTGIIDVQTWNVLLKKENGWKAKVLADSLQELYKVKSKQVQKASSKYIVVNIPNMTAYAYDYDTVTQKSTLYSSSKVVVGKPTTKTPIQDFDIWGVKYNPDWTPTSNMINRSVMKNGTVNTAWLKSHNITVTDSKGERVNYSDIESGGKYKYRQPSGDNNALGVFKFETTSKENIYLHDTNEKYLFSNNLRAYSSGCIRVEDYMDFAQFVLNKQPSEIEAQINTEKLKVEKINEQVPVYFSYAMSMPISQGYPAYYTDIYLKNSLYYFK